MITVTALAAEKLKGVLDEQGKPGSALRIIVMPGDHGLQYMLTLEESPREDDLVLGQDGVQIVVDSDSAPLLEGAELDYSEELMRSGFVITNPNAPVGGCACGGGGCGCRGE
ncbi:MAG: iron-sulfur cluster assembly accessory protein [Chloroflexi bacterium]|nr:iron-sulfur cluster assembly accessory protein [Chloroflexota bacterium]